MGQQLKQWFIYSFILLRGSNAVNLTIWARVWHWSQCPRTNHVNCRLNCLTPPIKICLCVIWHSQPRRGVSCHRRQMWAAPPRPRPPPVNFIEVIQEINSVRPSERVNTDRYLSGPGHSQSPASVSPSSSACSPLLSHHQLTSGALSFYRFSARIGSASLHPWICSLLSLLASCLPPQHLDIDTFTASSPCTSKPSQSDLWLHLQNIQLVLIVDLFVQWSNRVTDKK